MYRFKLKEIEIGDTEIRRGNLTHLEHTLEKITQKNMSVYQD